MDELLDGTFVVEVCRMTVQRIAGIILLVLGFVRLLAGGISWNQTKTIVDIGPPRRRLRNANAPMSPLLGVIALVGGIAPLRSRQATHPAGKPDVSIRSLSTVYRLR
jgi:hypothetical protein